MMSMPFLPLQRPDNLTTGAGHPIGDKLNIITAGPRGPLLVQDTPFIDEMAHFDRERIPERVVHAKGGGGCPALPIHLIETDWHLCNIQ